MKSPNVGRFEFKFLTFTSPYYEGDGYETLAFSVGKGKAGARWDLEGCKVGALIVFSSGELSVVIGYYNNAMMAEADSEKASNAAADL